MVTERYVVRSDQNPMHKVADGERVWHRMGDVGYLDEHDRFWFCGRKSQRVRSSVQVMFTERCEAIVNCHPRVFRSALVGVGPAGHQRPVFVVEVWPDQPIQSGDDQQQLIAEPLVGVA